MLRSGKQGLALLAGLGFLWFPAAGSDLEITKKAGDHAITIRIDRNPPIKGDNNLEIRIKDAAGNEVTNAKVMVNYYMPPMPRMAPMNYRKEAKLKKEKYTLKMDLIMEGPWYIVTKAAIGDKTLSAKFHIEVL